MAIIVDNDTRLVVQGLTGSEGRFHGLRNRNYGTQVVAGVTPGKGGQDVEGIPVFNTVADAVEGTGANTTLIFVPARFATDAIYEAVDAEIGTVICITEHIPAHDMLRVYTYLRGKGVTMIGPNCPGVLSPGKANVGIIPAEIFSEGAIGLVSRSGTLTYQIGHELTQLGPGNSTNGRLRGPPGDDPDRGGTARSRALRRPHLDSVLMDTISFARGVPAPECLPVEELADCARAALERDGATVLSYGSAAGYGPLRNWVAERHGVDPARVLLTNGSLQGMVFLAERFAGERVLVEAPTYDRPLKILAGR